MLIKINIKISCLNKILVILFQLYNFIIVNNLNL